MTIKYEELVADPIAALRVSATRSAADLRDRDSRPSPILVFQAQRERDSGLDNWYERARKFVRVNAANHVASRRGTWRHRPIDASAHIEVEPPCRHS